jgi:pyridoxal phosphate enzyme (YggS family)
MKVDIENTKHIVDFCKEIKIVAATKYVDIDQLYILEENGIKIFGENRVQDFLKKYEDYKGKCKWHFIGTLQSNKVKYIVDKVDLIHSVNSYKLIDEIDKQAKKINKIMNILIEVNIADEESKQGFDKSEIDDVVKYILDKSNINLHGLMMMAPNIEKEETRKFFKETKQLLEHINSTYDINLTELSMGMSNDYDIAIEEGATMVRIGRSLFK